MNLQLVYPRAIMALGLPVYFKLKYVIRKNKTKQKGKKQRKKSFQRRESNLGPPRQLILKTSVKLIIFNTLAYEILPVDAV